MIQLGYALSSEEHDAQTLIDNAARAEKAGFSFALISDHYHPWIEKQGQSPFVWSVLGGISQKTEHIQIGTGVTCPILRIHPAILAQAAATVQTLMQGRFFFGVGTGENLNEHIIGQGWPTISVRQAMLKEAIQFIRILWEGKSTSLYGEYYTVEDAKIYSLPATPPPIYIAASGPMSAILAGETGDGFITTSPDKKLVTTFRQAAGSRKPTYGQLSVCIAKTNKEAVEIALSRWPNSAIPGQFSQEARIPAYFEQVAKLVTPEHIKKSMVIGTDPSDHMRAIQEFADAGIENVYIHQIGPDQKTFFNFYKKEILPNLSSFTIKEEKKTKPATGRHTTFTPSLV